MHARAFGFFPQGFRDRKHESLAGVIGRHQRAGLERGGGSDIENAAALVLQHGWPVDLRQFQQRADIEIDHAELFPRFRSVHGAGDAVTGIVHQHIDIQILRGDLLRQFGAAAMRAQIERDGRGRDLVLCSQFLRRLFQRIGAARGENEIVAVLRETFREIQSDAVRSAGDERGLSVALAFACHLKFLR